MEYFQQSMDKLLKQQWFLPACVSAFGLLITIYVSIVVWELSMARERQLIKNTSIAKSELIEHQFLKLLPNVLRALERMRNRWVARQGTPFEDWQLDAANYVKDDQGLRAVGWVDNHYIVRWVEPIDGNKEALGLDLSFESKRKQALDLARQTGDYRLTKPIDLAPGGKGFLSAFPIYHGEQFQGFIIGVFDIELLVQQLLPENFTTAFNLAIYSQRQVVFENADEHLQFNPSVGHVSEFSFQSVSWQLYVWPKQLKKSGYYSYVPLVALVVGLCISVLLGIAIFYGLYSAATKRKLEKREIEYRATLDNTIDGIITTNDKGIVLTVNNAVEKLLGYGPDEIVGNNVKLLVPEPQRSEHDQYLENYANTKQPKIIGQGRAVLGQHKKGDMIPIQLGITSYTVAGNLYYCGVLRDISEQVEFEFEQDRLISELQKSNTELDSFAYIASHDLKEPLRAIKNHASFLLEDYDQQLDEDGQYKLQRLIYLTGRMDQLVSDLLYYSRLSREKPSIEQVDINELLAETLAMLTESFAEKNVSVQLNPMPKLRCDPVRLKVVFYNLIVNAYKYNLEAKKTIELSCDYHNELWCFHIRDNGIGISQRFSEDIFKIFKRLNSPKKFGEGTGAGLTFCKKIIEQHGGEIWFEPVLEGGTCFHFTIKENNDEDG